MATASQCDIQHKEIILLHAFWRCISTQNFVIIHQYIANGTISLSFNKLTRFLYLYYWQYEIKIKKAISNDTVFVPVFMNICQLVYKELGAQTHKMITDTMTTQSFRFSQNSRSRMKKQWCEQCKYINSTCCGRKIFFKTFILHTSFPKDIINGYEFNFTVISHSRKTRLV